MLSQAGYCYTQANLAVRFLEELNAETINMDPVDFEM
jgi:hypothetical protein